MSNWYSEAARFLNEFPDDYLVFDAETTGLQVESPSTFITQLGFATVRGRKLVDSGAVMLDWTRGPAAVPAIQYKNALAATRDQMAGKGKPYHTTWARVQAEGDEPIGVLVAFRGLLEEAAALGYSLVAHNGFAFDRPLIEAHLRRAGHPFTFDVERLVDTGLLEKCLQMEWSPPQAGSCDRKHWYHKVADARQRVKWSLDGACAERYGLDARHGLDPGNAHSADYDCICAHHLLEAMRERIED